MEPQRHASQEARITKQHSNQAATYREFSIRLDHITAAMNADNFAQQFRRKDRRISLRHGIAARDQKPAACPIRLLCHTMNEKTILPRIQHDVARQHWFKLRRLYG